MMEAKCFSQMLAANVEWNILNKSQRYFLNILNTLIIVRINWFDLKKQNKT